MHRRLTVCLVLATLAALGAPAGASAATTFGSDLTPATSSSVGCATFGLTAPCTTVLTGVHTGNAHVAAAPSGGVIVRVRVKTGGAETYTFRLARAATGGMTGGGGGPVLVTTAGTVSVFEVRVPVQAGDLLAADGSATTAYNCSGGSNEIYAPTLTDGAAGRTPSRSNPCELLVNADIEPDADTDGYGDETQDNCPGVANPGQEDNDGSGGGDPCDDNDDTDSDLDVDDNCDFVANEDQGNIDGDAEGDVCDTDDDNDGDADTADNCPAAANPGQEDNDGTGGGDACDANDDTDTVLDAADNCDFVANENQANNDDDALGDVCDGDDDNDTVLDAADACPQASDAARPRNPRNGCLAPAPAGNGGNTGNTGGSGGVLGGALSAAQVRKALTADLVAGVKKAGRVDLRKLVSSGGFTIGGIDALTGGTLRVVVTGPARRTGSAAKTLVYAKGKKTFAQAGKGKVRVKLTKKGRKRLRRARRARLKVRATFSANGLAKATAKRTLKLKRKRRKR